MSERDYLVSEPGNIKIDGKLQVGQEFRFSDSPEIYKCKSIDSEGNAEIELISYGVKKKKNRRSYNGIII